MSIRTQKCKKAHENSEQCLQFVFRNEALTVAHWGPQPAALILVASALLVDITNRNCGLGDITFFSAFEGDIK